MRATPVMSDKRPVLLLWTMNSALPSHNRSGSLVALPATGPEWTALRNDDGVESRRKHGLRGGFRQ